MTNKIYDGLRAVTSAPDANHIASELQNHGILFLPTVLSVTPLQSINEFRFAVDVSFQFLCSDGSTMTARATGIHVSSENVLTNAGLVQATRNALLCVFGCYEGMPVAKPVLATDEEVITYTTVNTPTPRPLSELLSEAKEKLDTTLVANGLPPTQTADTVEVKANPRGAKKQPETLPPTPVIPTVTEPKRPTNQQTAEQMKLLQEWRNGFNALNIEAPETFDAHLATIKTPQFEFLGQAGRVQEFIKLVQFARSYGVGWNDAAKTFYLLEIEEISDATPIPA